MKTADTKMLSTRKLVVINQDMTTAIPKTIWAHETPILEEIFGKDMIKEVDEKTLDEGFNPKASRDMLIHNKTQDPFKRPSETQGLGFVFIGEPSTEYTRLETVYGKHLVDNMSVCEKVYGRFQVGTFARMLGDKPTITDLPEPQIRSLLEESGYAPTGASSDMTKEEKAAAAKERGAFLSANKEALLKLAKEYAIEV